MTTALKDRLSEDMKAAMRAKDSARLGAIRFLLAAIKQREVDERISADDAVVLAVIEKMAKQRRDSIAQFEQAGRHDLADKEKAELALLQTYLPQPLSEDELLAAIRAAIAEAGGSGPQAMGKVMGLLKPRIAGRADPARASAMVRQLLAG
ncbi:MAG: GatB/YqeY domain-containing protein [Burkholderiales bacterium]|jgi:uncharacterized protein YqeY|nr:GatB/YqeY domain-containing protein [Burkholderiales bacterium]MCA3216265.1 GatB/YqeY domain-containing protein [Burkholderiales bacterium]MCA3227047.1 GatB/YqeY domain-containing protein [Burkholderiales bacterium]MCE2644497.1 GatB/YqeY domain-containing protein [Burkholderiaceae bacterium]